MLWPIVIGLGLGMAAGVIVVLMQSAIAKLILLRILQPGTSGVLLMPEDLGFAAILSFKLFALSTVFVAACVLTSWIVTWNPGRATMASLVLLCASAMVMSVGIGIYRWHMQEKVELSVNGQTLSRTRGQLTRLSDFPIMQLGLFGPLVVCAGAVAIRRKRIWSARRAV